MKFLCYGKSAAASDSKRSSMLARSHSCAENFTCELNLALILLNGVTMKKKGSKITAFYTHHPPKTLFSLLKCKQPPFPHHFLHDVDKFLPRRAHIFPILMNIICQLNRYNMYEHAELLGGMMRIINKF
jgi:hypothetical protein